MKKYVNKENKPNKPKRPQPLRSEYQRFVRTNIRAYLNSN